MARPLKRSADYFPHSAAARNAPEVRALRARYGMEGYATWCMLLELLCASDNFTHAWSDLDHELLAGDFGLSSERLVEITAYLERLKLVEINDQNLQSPYLEALLHPVLEKRILMQERYKQTVSATETVNSAAETIQRKGKERKGKDSSNTLSEIFKKTESEPEPSEHDPAAPHPAETALLNWASQHQDWLRIPIKEFEIQKPELDGGSITGELLKFARYYLSRAKPHVRAKFETDPGEFARNNWRDWLLNIYNRRTDKQQSAALNTGKTPTDKQPAELKFTDEEIYAISVSAVGEQVSNELHRTRKLYFAQKAPDKTQARERIIAAAKALEKSRAGPSIPSQPTALSSLINNHSTA